VLSFPLVWQRDLHDWLNVWVSTGQIRLEGMKSRQRKPKRGQNITIVKL
jgi:hypothetical protein